MHMHMSTSLHATATAFLSLRETPSRIVARSIFIDVGLFHLGQEISGKHWKPRGHLLTVNSIRGDDVRTSSQNRDAMCGHPAPWLDKPASRFHGRLGIAQPQPSSLLFLSVLLLLWCCLFLFLVMLLWVLLSLFSLLMFLLLLLLLSCRRRDFR